MLTFTFTDGRTAEAETLHAFMDRHFPPGLDIDAIWTGHTDFDGGAALLLMPRQEGHAFISLARIDGDGLSLGGHESDRISRGLMRDPFDVNGPTTNSLKERLDSFLYSTGLMNKPYASAELLPVGPGHSKMWATSTRPPATYTTKGDGFTGPLPREQGAAPAASPALGEERPTYKFALTDGRTIEAASLADFVDQHFPRGEAVDASWSGQSRFADDAILSVTAAGRSDTAISVVRIEGEGFSIGGTDPAGHGLTRLPDPLGAHGPVGSAQAEAFLTSPHATGTGAPTSQLRHIGTPEAWTATQVTAPTPAPATAPLARRYTADAPLIEKMNAGGALTDHARLQKRLDTDPMAALRDAPASARHVGRQL